MPRFLAAALLVGGLYLPPAIAGAEPVTLEQAIARGTREAPRLKASEAAIAAARADRLQALARPNPTLNLTAEDAVGTGAYNVLSQAEITASYAQTLERGGKRDARMAYAASGVGVAQALSRVARLDLAANVEKAWFDAVIADERAWAAQYRLKAEQDMQAEAMRRVKGYKDPLFVGTRASARVAQAEIALAEAKRKQAITRTTLAAYWGGEGQNLELPSGVLENRQSPLVIAPSDEAYEEARIAQARAGITVEETRKVQDYTVSGGVRLLRATGDVALVTGISIPLGRFDRNEGNIARARAERARLEYEAEADRLERLRRLASLRADAESARMLADSIRQQVVPKTVQTLDEVRAGYRRGGFTFRDVQDAADAIVEAQEQWLSAANNWRDLQTEIDRLSGRFDVSAGEETEQ